MHKQFFIAVLVVVSVGIISCENKKYPDLLTPENALKSFQIDSNFTIKIFAAEPFVKDPVSLAFDDEGNAFVVEMPDYPFPLIDGKLSGDIKVLRDIDGDGRVDSAVIFADGLGFATSILPWKGGLIVTAAPNILYLKDTTGDFKADIKEVLFSGFFNNNPEAQITSLSYGVDNWIYAANYGQESKVIKTGSPDTNSLSIAGADFRFRLDKSAFEPVTGTAQFGQSLDDWGHRFLTSNSNHIKQSVFPWQYLHRNPSMKHNDGTPNISDHGQIMFQQTPAPYWRIERTKRRNAKYKEGNLDRIEYADNHFSGASGGTYYNGDAFPSGYYGNYFTTEVSGNLIHRDILVASDSSPVYIAKSPGAASKREFLTSTDEWFRPASLTVGPDGYLYVVDMYRQHIETPFSIDEDLKKEMDFKNGTQNGRIYRIVPKNKKPVENPLKETKNFNAADWVKLLVNPNGMIATKAQRKLVELQDKSVVPELVTLFNNSKDARVRLKALYTLEGLNSLDEKMVMQAINDVEPGIRENGLILGERYPNCKSEIIKRMNDSVVRVAFQACLSGGNFSANEIFPSFKNIIEKYGYDRWLRLAILSSREGSSLNFLKWLREKSSFFADTFSGKLLFVEDISDVIGARNEKGEMVGLLEFFSKKSGMLQQEKWMISMLKGVNTSVETEDVRPVIDATVIQKLKSIAASSPSVEVKKLIAGLVENK